MSRYETFFTDTFTKAVTALDSTVKKIVEKRIEKILENPTLAKPLHGEPMLFSERFSKYRIIYKIDGARIIFLKLGKRDEIYR